MRDTGPGDPGHDTEDRRDAPADGHVHRLRAGVTWCEAGTRTVALDLTHSVYFSLNRSGTLLWRRLSDGGATTDQLIRVLARNAGIDPGRARADTEGFLRAMRDHALLQ